MGDTILSVRDLVVKFSLRGRTLTAIRSADLDLYEGETLAIVGESGSGKSVFTKTFIGMLDKNGRVDSGSIMFEGRDLAKYSTEKEWLTLRGKKISMVFQDPMTALNPVLTVGEQVSEVIQLHEKISSGEATMKATKMLELVGIGNERYKWRGKNERGGGNQEVVSIDTE